MLIKLTPPADAVVKEAEDRETVKAHVRARKVSLSSRKWDKLENKVRKMVLIHKENTGNLRGRLRDLNEFLEGKTEEIDWPFGPEDSSRIDVRLAASYLRTLRANIVRAALSSHNPFVVKAGPGSDRKDLKPLEDALNWTSTEDNNLIDVLKESITPIYRDGTAIVFGDWDRMLERGCDFRLYQNVADFQADYPDAESAKISRRAYNRLIREAETLDRTVQVEYEVDFISKNRPEFTLCPLAKFIWGPLHATKTEELDLYGFAYNEGHDRFEMRVKAGEFNLDAVEACRKKSGDRNADEWDRSRDILEGLNTDDEAKVSYNFAHLIVRIDMDGDKVPERYVVTYDLDKDKILGVKSYGLRRNIACMVPLRFIHRDGRFLGISLLGDGEDMFRLVNAIHRHRSNVRRLTDSVTLIMPNSLKDEVDFGAEYATFVPGLTLWVPNELMASGAGPQQLQLHNLSNSRDSTDEESLAVRYLELLVGPTQGQSGQGTPDDPKAPGNKTAMLLNRADIRTEDFIDEMVRTIPDLLDLARALYFQNVGGKLDYMVRARGELEEKSLQADILAMPGTRISLKSVKTGLDPVMEMNKISALASMAIQLQGPVQANPMIIIEYYNAIVAASRVDFPEKYMIEIDGQGQASMGGNPIDMQQMQAALLGGGAGAVAPPNGRKPAGRPT